MICPHCSKEISDSLIWQHVAAIAGRSKSEAKAAAARINGLKGGRPMKAKRSKDQKPAMIKNKVLYNDGNGYEEVKVYAVSDTDTTIEFHDGKRISVGIYSLKGPGVREIRELKRSAKGMKSLFRI